MERRIVNPWEWQESSGYVQAVEVTNPQGTLYVSGQAAMDDDGNPSDEVMRTQIRKTLENLEKVILTAGYELHNIVRLNIYTTDSSELFQNFDLIKAWFDKYPIRQASTVMEVKSLFKTLKVELEATVVR